VIQTHPCTIQGVILNKTLKVKKKTLRVGGESDTPLRHSRGE